MLVRTWKKITWVSRMKKLTGTMSNGVLPHVTLYLSNVLHWSERLSYSRPRRPSALVVIVNKPPRPSFFRIFQMWHEVLSEVGHLGYEILWPTNQKMWLMHEYLIVIILLILAGGNAKVEQTGHCKIALFLL